MEVADAPDRHADTARDAASAAPSRITPPARPKAAAKKKKNKKARAFWLKQLHTWHWVSAAISLVGMLLFAATGITLNHAASIGAEPSVTQSQGKLPVALLAKLPAPGDRTDPLPAEVAKAVAAAVPLDPSGRAADWTAEDEVYVAMPGPGRDAWVSIDRASGEVQAEVTDRGWISYLNDLHKGRNTGAAWSWFIDIFAAACLVFCLTGLFILKMHAGNRPFTWPMVGLGLVIPALLALLFIH